MSGVAGPSAARFAKCAKRFAQDDDFVVGEQKAGSSLRSEWRCKKKGECECKSTSDELSRPVTLSKICG